MLFTGIIHESYESVRPTALMFESVRPTALMSFTGIMHETYESVRPAALKLNIVIIHYYCIQYHLSNDLEDFCAKQNKSNCVLSVNYPVA